MFGSEQFGRSQFGQPPQLSSPDATVSVGPLDALADIGPFLVSTTGRAGRPPWLPLIPADWPVRPKPVRSVVRDSVANVGSFDCAATVGDVSVSCDCQVRARRVTAMAGVAFVSVSA